MSDTASNPAAAEATDFKITWNVERSYSEGFQDGYADGYSRAWKECWDHLRQLAQETVDEEAK